VTGSSALDATALAGAALHVARLAPVAALSPFLGGPLVPGPVRATLAVGAGLAAFLLHGSPPVRAEGLALAGLVARELALGAALAVMATAPVEAARAAGRLADTLRGATLAELHVAPLRQRETALGDLLVHLLVVLAATGGGLPLVLRGLLLSFGALPAGAPFPAAALPAAVLPLAAATLASALAVAAPAVAGVLAADLATSALARAAPGLALTEAVQPARAALGLTAMAVALAAGAGRLVAFLVLALGDGGDTPLRIVSGAVLAGPGGAP
jgi:type III secretory pathway component EscT